MRLIDNQKVWNLKVFKKQGYLFLCPKGMNTCIDDIW